MLNTRLRSIPERGWRLLSERGSSSFPDRGLRAGPRRQDGTALAPATQPPPMARRLVAADLITLATGVVRAVDPLVVALAAWIAYWARHGSWVLPDLYMIAIAAACVLTLNIMQLGRVYAFENLSRLPTQVGRLAWAWTAVILVLIALAYFTQTSLAFSRAFVLGWIAISFGFLLIVRVLFLLRVDAWRRDGRLSLDVAIIGAGALGRQLIRQLLEEGAGRYRIAGIFDDDPADGATSVEGYPVIGSIDDLVRLAQVRTFDEVVVALPWAGGTELNAVLKKLKTVPVNVKICPDYVGWSLPSVGFHMLGGIPMLAALDRPLKGWQLVVKAIEDRVLAAIAITFFAPLLAGIALLVKLDSRGPVLFKQKRYGFANNEFTVFKFRTMQHREAEDPNVPQARRNDPRITRIGGFLRRTSLDELPQLFNVLLGDMSLVGPRPHAVAHNVQFAQIIDDYLSRHRVKPGITGWAQINGLRGETDTPEKMRARVSTTSTTSTTGRCCYLKILLLALLHRRVWRSVQHDLYYIDNWSLLLDLKILLLTPFHAAY
jgi:Undecaprenyl-phosphate glucose phosphotransferase